MWEFHGRNFDTSVGDASLEKSTNYPLNYPDPAHGIPTLTASILPLPVLPHHVTTHGAGEAWNVNGDAYSASSSAFPASLLDIFASSSASSAYLAYSASSSAFPASLLDIFASSSAWLVWYHAWSASCSASSDDAPELPSAIPHQDTDVVDCIRLQRQSKATKLV